MCNAFDSINCLLCATPFCEELDCEFPDKDRSASRKRHLNDLKAKERAKKASAILDAKYRNLSAYATIEEECRAGSRAFRASKKVERLLPKAERYETKVKTA